jgi:prevent-host-death family protein
MKTVGVRELKDNPTRALREARHGPVLVTNRDEPDALLVSFDTLRDFDADLR